MGSSIPSPRAYLRHPTDIPIQINVRPILGSETPRLKDVSLGGLSCRCEHELDIGTPVDVLIELVQPPFHATGRVAWCHKCEGHHELGIQFLQQEDAFAARMVEQICHIEHYRNEVMRREGRVLDGHDAAMEWIHKYASDFPEAGTFLMD